MKAKLRVFKSGEYGALTVQLNGENGVVRTVLAPRNGSQFSCRNGSRVESQTW